MEYPLINLKRTGRQMIFDYNGNQEKPFLLIAII